MKQKWPSGATAADIAASLEHGIHSGRTGPGALLPTVRDLAAQLRVSPATVAAAYKLAHGRGLVSGAGRRGTRVAPRPPSPHIRAGVDVAPGTIDLASGNP